MLRDQSLSIKLPLSVIGGAALVFAAAFTYNYYSVRGTLLHNVNENARNLTIATVNKVQGQLSAVERLPEQMAARLSNRMIKPQEMEQSMLDCVNSTPEAFGMATAFSPYGYDETKEYFEPYVYRKGEKVELAYPGGPSYNYFTQDWYHLPKELERAVWSEPYYDEGGGGIIMATYSVPFRKPGDSGGKVWGIATADLSLEWLRKAVAGIRFYRSGYAFAISANGIFITHPQEPLIMNESIFSVAEGKGDPELRRIGRSMIKGEEGFVKLVDFSNGRPSWMYYAPLGRTGGSLALIFPEDELFADAWKLSQRLVLIAISGFALLCALVTAISGRITRPIRLLAAKAGELSRGNLDTDLPAPRSHDEIGQLTNSFTQMRTALKEYIANLAATTAAKERIESELKIASAIQHSFLPKKFPPFPDQTSFDLYAAMDPAKEVGGDFYDFFLLDRERLFFTIGDVSGKGVPAALFMAVSKTLIKGTAEPHLLPSDVLRKVNIELSRENDAAMFVTVFCGILNFKTGELVYSNGGHNPPLITSREQNPRFMEVPEGVILGGFEESQYSTATTRLAPGETILLYTDGVTEAFDTSGQIFGEERLLLLCDKLKNSASAEGLVKGVLSGVERFYQGVTQSDDITVLAISFKKRKG